MRERENDRRRERDRVNASSSLASHAHPILALQRAIGNHAVAQVLARKPAPGSAVQVPGVGEIKVKDGNLEQWTGSEAPDTVEVTSHKGRHSAKLEHLATAGTKSDVKVKIAPAGKAGEELNVGGGTELEIKGSRIKDYAVEDGVETWRLVDFTNVHCTKITHRVS